MGTHFKSKKAYKKYIGYIWAHHIPHEHHRYVYIHGKRHRVKK